MIPASFASKLSGLAGRDAYLAEIPTETSAAERAHLFALFAQSWDGTGHVVEIGPFLGGSTRAIACGMAANTRRQANALLHTVDRFDEYYSAPMLREAIEPMVRKGVFSAAQADDLCRVADFERLFHAIHDPQPYAPLVRIHNSPLPDRPEEVSGSASLGFLADERELGALFIDGCKSWTGTRYAMEFLLPRTRVGAPVIFQDFGWYTCFWVSSFVAALDDLFEFESQVDPTYVFRLRRPVTAGEIARRFAATPEEMGVDFYQKAAERLFTASQQRGDLRGELIAQLHHVAALVTLGRRNAAAAILKRIQARRYAAFADMISGCLRSPTYLPGGTELVWNTAA